MRLPLAFRNWVQVMALAVALVALQSWAKPTTAVEDAPQLTVLFTGSEAEGLTAEDAVALLNAPPGRTDADVLRNQLGHPRNARLLLTNRLPAEVLSRMPMTAPLAILHHWVVLDYPGNSEARTAKAQIKLHPELFRAVYQSQVSVYFSATPTDPLYGYGEHPRGSSSAGVSTATAHARLNVPSAFDQLTGTAYVGVFDNGLDGADFSAGPGAVHPDLAANVRAQFSWSVNDHGHNVVEPNCPNLPWRGHGTHVAGLIGAAANNSQGTSGVCPTCSLAIIRRRWCATNMDPPTDTLYAQAIVEAAQMGLQVFSHSGGMGGQDLYDNNLCTGDPSQPVLCTAVATMTGLDVSYVAASGNAPDMSTLFPGSTQPPHTHFPSYLPSVISVGSTDEYGNPSSFSAHGKVDFAAPGERVFSTFFQAADWNPNNPYGPGTSCIAQSTDPSETLSRYGYCTGTSMSTPLISGSFALVRSANPLLTHSAATALLQQTSSAFTAPDTTTYGYGAPDVAAAVRVALWGPQGNGGVTPLFSLTSPFTLRHFYTVVPQMAVAANCRTLKNGVNGWFANSQYQASTQVDPADGTPVAGYPAFPFSSGIPCTGASSATPVATFKVFTTTSRAGQSLVPLYRLSRSAEPTVPTYGPPYDAGPASNTTSTAGHAYATSPSELTSLGIEGYVLDGIEGYVFPPSGQQPSGTIAVYRRYHAARNDYGLFSADQLATAGAGYVTKAGYQDAIGFACPNVSSPVGVCSRGAIDLWPILNMLLLD